MAENLDRLKTSGGFYELLKRGDKQFRHPFGRPGARQILSNRAIPRPRTPVPPCRGRISELVPMNGRHKRRRRSAALRDEMKHVLRRAALRRSRERRCAKPAVQPVGNIRVRSRCCQRLSVRRQFGDAPTRRRGMKFASRGAARRD